MAHYLYSSSIDYGGGKGLVRCSFDGVYKFLMPQCGAWRERGIDSKDELNSKPN